MQTHELSFSFEFALHRKISQVTKTTNTIKETVILLQKIGSPKISEKMLLKVGIPNHLKVGKRINIVNKTDPIPSTNTLFFMDLPPYIYIFLLHFILTHVSEYFTSALPLSKTLE